jgi:hypothetical protein
MKTPIFQISLASFSIISLILLSSFVTSNGSYDTNSSGKSGFIHSEQKKSSLQNLNYFERRETGIEYKLTYGWKDYTNKEYTMDFPISKKQLLNAENEFGYYPEELREYLEEHLQGMRREMILSLKKFTSQLIAKSKYPQYILIEEIDAQNFAFKISVSRPYSLYKEVKIEFDRIRSLLAAEHKKYIKKIDEEQEKLRRDYFKKKGFRFIGNKIGVNYRRSIINNRPRVKHVMTAMKKKNEKLSLHQFLALMLAFIQEIKFEIPPLQENKKFIMEFWVPPKVLVYNRGDCDSKGVTFASMWTNFERYPIILIRIPRHLFIGLAIPSLKEEGFTINGLRYTLCEVTGPDKMPPGMITPYSRFYLQGGKFRYEIIR